MIFESIKAAPLCIDRKSIPTLVNRRRSSACLQENKIQVLVMGSSKVGKTSMIERLTGEKIVNEEGTPINTEDIQVEVIVELMDIQDTLDPQLRRFAIQTAHAYILMYSMDDPQSFNKIDEIKGEIEKVKGPGMPMIVVGNKADLPKRKQKSLGTNSDCRTDRGIPHIKMSHKNGPHICEIYEQLFKHQTLRKLTNIISTINSCSLFTDLRRLSMKAEKLEENMAMIFSPTQKCAKRSNSLQLDWNIREKRSTSLLPRLKGFFKTRK